MAGGSFSLRPCTFDFKGAKAHLVVDDAVISSISDEARISSNKNAW